jgi:hypothetical protein
MSGRIASGSEKTAVLPNVARPEIGSALRAGLQRLERASAQLASQGWALPMSLTPNETYQLLDAGSPEDVDAAFVSLYEAEDGSYFQEVTRDLLDREVLAPWRPLLDQVISAYQRLDFAITIPALLTVCEGVLRRDSVGVR